MLPEEHFEPEQQRFAYPLSRRWIFIIDTLELNL